VLLLQLRERGERIARSGSGRRGRGGLLHRGRVARVGRRRLRRGVGLRLIHVATVK
jgi:hypothetical protein